MLHDAEMIIRRHTAHVDSIRSYTIEIDGVASGAVANGEEVSLYVRPGNHVISLSIDWCGSPSIPFTLSAAQSLVFECGSNLVGWKVVLGPWYLLFRRRQYLWLRRAS
jgi:hypothetical protein